MIRVLLLLLLVPTIAGCGAAAAPSAPGEPPGLSGTWKLEAGTGPGGRIVVLEEHPITLAISESEVTGTAACNGYAARIDRAIAGGVTIGELGMTAMGCEPDVMASEAAYSAALSRVDMIELDGDRLLLSGPDVRLEFERLPPIPTADVVDTVWILESLLVGDVASSAAGDRATLVVSADGGLEGSTGCRTFSGIWVEAGGQIRATTLGMGDEVCPQALESQDSHVVSVIGDGFVPSVEGDLLTLLDAGGVGLVYRAED